MLEKPRWDTEREAQEKRPEAYSVYDEGLFS